MKKIRAQSEIMGLAMVMVLITIGILIYLKFAVTDASNQSASTRFMNKQFPVLLNDALLQTHLSETDCYGEKMQTILIKCASGNSFVCSNNQDSCTFAQEWLKKYLNQVLGDRYDYIYTVYTGDDYKYTPNFVFNQIRNGTCIDSYGRGMERSSETFFFRMPNGKLLNMKLDLCS